MNDALRGVIAPLFTPCLADGTIDVAGAAGLVDSLAATGCVRSVFARSGMGKMFTFTVEEAKALGRAVTARAHARGLGALLGCAGEWRDKEAGGPPPDPETYLAQSIELARFTAEIGADAAVLLLPEACVPNDADDPEGAIYRYLHAVHEATAIPIVLYQSSGLPPNVRLSPALLRRLLNLPRIAGAKISTDREEVFRPLAEAVRGNPFALICGDEGYYLRGLQLGAVGVIGEGCNAYPELLDAVGVLYHQGRAADAERAQRAVREALAAKDGMDGGLAWQQMMIHRGARCSPHNRSGHAPYPPEQIAALDAAVREIAGPIAVLSRTVTAQTVTA